MATEYDINLSNGNVLATLYPLETNGPDNHSTPRQIRDVRPQYQITLVVGSPGAGTISIVGDFTNVFRVGQQFEIVGSTGNNGTYTVAGIASGGGNTQITTVENVVDNNADGDIIAHVFILNGDLAYRFVSAFTFDVTLSGEVDGTYTVTALNSIASGNTTIIPVVHGSIRDNLIASIALPYGQLQYTNTDANTSLKLPGRSTLHYGEMIVENMVRMTEHFANDLAPELNTNIGSTPAGSPMIGQLWYRTLSNEEGFLFYDGTDWTNHWDFDNGLIILRDPQNTTTPNSNIYLTGDESQLPAGYLGTSESGMVIWNEVDPVAQDAILRVVSVDGTENLRVEHDGYIRTANNLEVIGGGNGTTESYFHGQVGIGNDGLPTIERTLTVEGDGISINSDNGTNAGLVLDCPSITEQSVVEFEVADVLMSSIHTETNVRTVWESPGQTTADVSILEIRGGNTVSGANAGNISLLGGHNTFGDYGGNVSIVGGGSNANAKTAGGVTTAGGVATDANGGTVNIFGGQAIGTSGHRSGGTVNIVGGGTDNIGDGGSGGNVDISGGDHTGGSGGTGGDISIEGGSVDDPSSTAGSVSISSGQTYDFTGGASPGNIIILSGPNMYGGDTGYTIFGTGDCFGVDPNGTNTSGDMTIRTGNNNSGGFAGTIEIKPGDCSSTSNANGAPVRIASGTSGGGGATKGGDIILTTAGSGISGADDGIIDINGNVDITGTTRTTGSVGINTAAPISGTISLGVSGGIQTNQMFWGGNGSVITPTYSFTNNPNSGMISAAVDRLGFVVSGTNVFNVEADGTLSVNAAAYETLVLADNDIPNKKFVDDRVSEYDTLAELTDVTLTAPSEDQVLTYSGGQWVNKSALPQYEEYVATGGEVIVNTTIPTVANTGSPGLATLQVFRNGVLQMEGATKNYTVTGGNQITFNAVLVALDDVVIYSFNR